MLNLNDLIQKYVRSTLLILFHVLLNVHCQLLINIQNQGGEIIQETITSNVTDELVSLEFQRSDGTLISLFIDFKNEVNVLKALELGEEERGQNQYQVMCFVTKFIKDDFISAEAMAKLRQKNPSTVRIPEEDRGKETITMTSWIYLNKSATITRHLPGLCSEAGEATYVREMDVKSWAELSGSSLSSLEAATKPFPDSLISHCSEVTSLWAPCLCTLEMCIGWYPCGLKYCKGKPDQSKGNGKSIANYRCGIKTCRKCTQYIYYVRQKEQCLWDE